MCVLKKIRKTLCGTVNPGGGRQVFIAPLDAFIGDWGTNIDEDPDTGLIMAGPNFVAGQAWVEMEVSEKSLKLIENCKNPAGYMSWDVSFELKVAGASPEQRMAVEKLVNTEIVAVIRYNDGQRRVIGSTIATIEFEITNDSGAKGSDQRGYTFKAKCDGLAKSCAYLDEAVMLDIAA